MVKWFNRKKKHYTVSLNNEKPNTKPAFTNVFTSVFRADFNRFYYNFMRQVLITI